MISTLTSPSKLLSRVKENWKSGLTVAFISIPLSIALSIASGAGPLPGIITGVWATLIAGFFGGSDFNIIGAAGALTTVLFAATLAAPFGLGASILPLLALGTGLIIFTVWLLKLDRFLYYVPSSVMYGFAAGVALLIAASQLFDATGLSAIKRTGKLIGDLVLFGNHMNGVHLASIVIFFVFLGFILIWKKYVKAIPAVIPAAVLGIIAGYVEATFFPLGLISLADKFGAFQATLMLPVAWNAIPQLLKPDTLVWFFQASGLVALIAVLETLITAKISDKLTKKESSSSQELLGLALANLGSGVMGGLPATGVFIRTGANIKAGATHRTSGILTALFTGGIALLVLPFFSYLPVAVIAAILVNTALGLLEVEKFKEFWTRERESFFVAILVMLITIFEDAGTGVMIGAVLALLLFARRVARGRFDVIWNYADGSVEEESGERHITIPEGKQIEVATYSIAGNLGYIDASRHVANLKHLAHAKNIDAVIIRLRNLFSIDYEGTEALGEGVEELRRAGKKVRISSASGEIKKELMHFPVFKKIAAGEGFSHKASLALAAIKAEK